MPKRRKQTEIGLSSFLTADEKRILLNYLRSKTTTLRGRKRLLIADIMINSGVRAFELCNLRLRDLPEYLGGHAIQVHRGKGGKSRTIPISRRLVDEIAEYIQGDRARTMPRHVKRKDPAGFLFYSERRRKLRYDALRKMLIRAGLNAGIRKRTRPHVFRHSFATLALDNGAPLKRLQRWLGHTHLSTTERYLHRVSEGDFELAERLDCA